MRVCAGFSSSRSLALGPEKTGSSSRWRKLVDSFAVRPRMICPSATTSSSAHSEGRRGHDLQLRLMVGSRASTVPTIPFAGRLRSEPAALSSKGVYAAPCLGAGRSKSTKLEPGTLEGFKCISDPRYDEASRPRLLSESGPDEPRSLQLQTAQLQTSRNSSQILPA